MGMRSNLKLKMPRSPDKIISEVAKSKQKSKKVTMARAEPKLKQPCAVVELAPLWSVQCNHKRAQRKLQKPLASVLLRKQQPRRP